MLECLFGSLSLVLLLFGCFFVRRRRVSLFFFSRRWGTTNRVAVCGSPCVFFLATLYVIDPYVHHRNYTKAWPPHLRFVFCFWFVFVVGVSLSLSLCLSLSPWCRSPLRCKHVQEKKWGWPTRRRPLLLSRLFFLASFGGKSIGQCPGQ